MATGGMQGAGGNTEAGGNARRTSGHDGGGAAEMHVYTAKQEASRVWDM